MSPEIEKKGSCKLCRRYVGEGAQRRERFPNEQDRRSLGCETCDLDGSDGFAFLPRVTDLLDLHYQCSTPGLGRTIWPYDPSPRRNPLFIQYGFRVVEKMIHKIEESLEAQRELDKLPDGESK